jgi:hypothetical protein
MGETDADLSPPLLFPPFIPGPANAAGLLGKGVPENQTGAPEPR